MSTFDDLIAVAPAAPLTAAGIDTIQVNVGFRCNQACVHCHVGASPDRTEAMDRETMDMVVRAAGGLGRPLVDMTGGAPELNPSLPRFIAALRAAGHPVQVRTNLTVLLEPGVQGMPGFFRDHGVRLVASMPCYLEENVDAQRGPGAYARSVEAIRILNDLGYGREDGLQLDLVYNPAGPSLPPEQAALEADYRRELGKRFGIEFSCLLTITNMPIGRFRESLHRTGRESGYLDLLADAFNPQTVEGLMCRHQISVGWDGTLYDCDFNMALGRAVTSGVPRHVRDFDARLLIGRDIVTGDHCLGCTAGCGSSCGGALV